MPNDGNRIWAENGVGIDIEKDIYKVLGIAKTGDFFDIATACNSNKLRAGQKHKPTRGGEQGFVLKGATTDPSPSDMCWSVKPVVCPNKRIGDFIRYQATQVNQWEYYPPVINTHWQRFYDFDEYLQNAPQYAWQMCTAGPTADSVPIDSATGVPLETINLFKQNIVSVFMEMKANTGFRIDEFFQHKPNLRFVVEVYNTYTYNTDGVTKTYWYDAPDQYLIAKYCFDTMSAIAFSKQWDINLYELMVALNIPVKSLGSIGYPATMVFGLQEADAQTTTAAAISGKNGGVAGTGVTVPGYRTRSGGTMYLYNFTIANEWAAEMEDFQYGFIQRGINNTNIQWKSSPATSQGLYEIYTNWADTDNQSLVKDGANLFLKATIRNTTKATESGNTLNFVNNINADGIKLAVIRSSHTKRDVMPVRFFPTADYVTYSGASSSVREMSSFSVAPGESKTIYLLVENFFVNDLGGGLSQATEYLYWNSARVVWTQFKGTSYPTEAEFADSDNTLSWADGKTVSNGVFNMGTWINT